MRATNSETRSAAAWRLARRQHGVLTRRDLLRLGFGAKAIRHRLATGRLHRVWRGVYAVGRADLSQEGRWMAAVLACGESAALGHGSAAALWGFAPQRRGSIEVCIQGNSERRRPGIRARTRPTLPAEDVTTHRGIPVTTPPRTLLDLAAERGPRLLERAVNEADALELIDPESLRAWLEERRGEPGVRPLSTLLGRATFRLSDSELEVRFRPLALAAGLPQPQTKVFVNDFEVDFYWPTLGLVVETDSLRYHRTASKQARDLLRDQTHIAGGLTPLRFTHWQVRYEPRHVQKILSATLRLRLHPAGAAGAGSRPS